MSELPVAAERTNVALPIASADESLSNPTCSACVALTSSAGELVLTPERAVWLASLQTLLIADVHLGKAASFRALGVPVPEATTDGSLARLDAALARWQPMGVRRLVILGDLLHAQAAQRDVTMRSLRQWRERHPGLAITLILGNHDARAGRPPADLAIDVAVDSWRCDQVLCIHAPDDLPPVDQRPALCFAGHLHPAVRLSGRGRDQLRLPCFWRRPDGLWVLPAFGEFTGGWSLRDDDGGQRWALTHERVFAVPQPGRSIANSRPGPSPVK